MHRFGISVFAAALISALLTLCGGTAFSQVKSIVFLDKDSIKHKAQVEDVIKNMPVRQKVAQLFIVEISRNPSDRTKARQDSLIGVYGVGNIIVMRGPIHQFMERVNALQKMAAIPLMVATDAEWGAAMRFPEYLSYPRQAQLGRIEKGAEKLLYKMGRNVGKELKDLNIMVNYAPVADVSAPDNESDSQRSFSNDPHQVSALATAYMKGMQDAGIYACGKHYPGHGGTTVDSHYEMPVIDRTREYLDSVDMFPYFSMFAAGLEMVMVGHFAVPSIDSRLVPMSISSNLINGVLRHDQGFRGVVITDAVAMAGLTNKDRNPVEASMEVYRAGADMILMTDQPMKCIDAIAEKVESGQWPMEELDAKVRKVLTLKARAGYLEDGFNPQVRHLDRKIAAARKRDYRLIKKMQRKILKSSKPYIAPIGDDKTLLLDKAGQ